jgi:2-polyprenylphenol 6-hydroxylase
VSATKRYDIVIVGAGMVGATLACALRHSGLHCALIDFTPHETNTTATQFDLRVSAITRASQRIFAALGVWPAMLAQRVAPFREMHVWDSSGQGELHFDSAELGEALLGHIIENRVITAALLAGLQGVSNIDVLQGQRCQRLQRHADGWQVILADGRVLETALLVGADGSRSWLREQLQIRLRGWDYDHTALVTYVKTALPHQATAWQRFLPTGPLAFLPLSDGYSSIVWSTSDERARALREMDNKQFAQELEQALESRLGGIETVGPRATYPLRFLHTEHYIADGVALLGDAAHTMHPLAGQGVNLGLTDAAALAEVVREAKQQRQSICARPVLRRYERWRRADNLPMLVAVDNFQRMFATEQPLLAWTRRTGMAVLNQVPPVKNFIIEYAMGKRLDLPKLARGEAL